MTGLNEPLMKILRAIKLRLPKFKLLLLIIINNNKT